MYVYIIPFSATTIPTPPPTTNCGKDFFPCYSNLSEATICLPNAEKCDGKADCYEGQDEKNCSKCLQHLDRLMTEYASLRSLCGKVDQPCKARFHVTTKGKHISLIFSQYFFYCIFFKFYF